MSDKTTDVYESQREDYIAALERAVELRESERDNLTAMLQGTEKQLAEKDAAIAELVKSLEWTNVELAYSLDTCNDPVRISDVEKTIRETAEIIKKHKPRKDGES